MSIEKPDMLGAVETWLDSKVLNEELICDNYVFYRKDRLTRGGGIILYVKDVYRNKRREDLESNCVNQNEILVCEVDIGLQTPVVYILAYRPPNADILFNNNLKQVLNNVRNSGFSNICLLGDLNVPEIEWNSMMADNLIQSNLCDILEEYNLVQINSCPSRRTSNNILEIVLTTFHDKFKNVHTSESLVNTDHLQLNFSITTSKLNLNRNKVHRKIYLFKNYNFDELRYYVSCENFDTIIERNKNDVNMAWTEWKTRLMWLLDKYIPTRVLKNGNNSPWLDGDVVHNAHLKQTARKKAIKSNLERDWIEYRRIMIILKI